jgi:adenine-specific DNA methylase
MTTCTHDPMFTHDGRCAICRPRKRIVAVQHRDGTREIDPSLMTMPQVLARRAAASGLRGADDMRREIAAALETTQRLAAEKVRQFEAHMAELTDDDITLMEAMRSNDVKWTHYNSATEGA